MKTSSIILIILLSLVLVTLIAGNLFLLRTKNQRINALENEVRALREAYKALEQDLEDLRKEKIRILKNQARD